MKRMANRVSDAVAEGHQDSTASVMIRRAVGDVASEMNPKTAMMKSKKQSFDVAVVMTIRMMMLHADADAAVAVDDAVVAEMRKHPRIANPSTMKMIRCRGSRLLMMITRMIWKSKRFVEVVADRGHEMKTMIQTHAVVVRHVVRAGAGIRMMMTIQRGDAGTCRLGLKPSNCW